MRHEQCISSTGAALRSAPGGATPETVLVEPPPTEAPTNNPRCRVSRLVRGFRWLDLRAGAGCESAVMNHSVEPSCGLKKESERIPESPIGAENRSNFQ